VSQNPSGQEPFVIEPHGSGHVVRLHGERFGGVELLEELDRRLTEIAQRASSAHSAKGPKILIDFTDLTFASSGLLGLLAAASGRLRQHGGEMHACNLDEDLQELFRRVHLDKLVTVHATAQEAWCDFQ
jgi:anti-anti-sigma factor